MQIFFAGRLWTSPAVMSRVDDTAMFNRNPGVGNILALIGPADGGEPKTPLRFGSPSDAAATLRGGELLDAVLRAFSGSPETPGPATIVAVRTQPATRATLALNDIAAQPVINLTSQVWGALANRVQVTIASGTTRGKRIRTKLDAAVYEQDNVGRPLFEVAFTGAAASATVSISGANVILAAPAGSTVATITFADAPTVQEVVDRINAISNWSATVLDGRGEHPTAGRCDFISAGDAKAGPVMVAADLEAIVDWFNSAAESVVVAAKVANAGSLPINISATYLAGATTGSANTQDWADAFTALQQADVQWVVPVSGSSAVHAMAMAHCMFTSDVLRKERRAIVGTVLATSDAAAIAAAKNLNSERVALTHLGGYDYDTASNLTLFPPYIVAAMIAGGFAGVNPGTAMTNKALALRGMERKLRNPTDTDLLLMGGVIPVEDTPTGYRVVQSISTWLTSTNYNKREMSVGAAVDYIARAVREALQPLVGTKNGPSALAQAIARTRATLEELARPEPQGIAVIVGDQANPAYRNIRVEAEGDVLRCEFECSPVIPINYIPISIFAVPFSGTAQA